jgi:hypothetical protein
MRRSDRPERAVGLIVRAIAIVVGRGVGRTAVLSTLKDPREDAHGASDRDHISEIARLITVSESRARADVFLRRQCLDGTPTKESCARASEVSTAWIDRVRRNIFKR